MFETWRDSAEPSGIDSYLREGFRLSVLLGRAMPEPQLVERTTSKFPHAFLLQTNQPLRGRRLFFTSMTIEEFEKARDLKGQQVIVETCRATYRGLWEKTQVNPTTGEVRIIILATDKPYPIHLDNIQSITTAQS